MGDDGSDAARSRSVPVGFAGVAFVADDGARLNVRSDVEQGLEVTPVGGFAASQVEGENKLVEECLGCVDEFSSDDVLRFPCGIGHDS